MKSQIAISSLIWTSSVFAHTIFQRVHVNGVDQGYLKGVRHPTYNGPITDVTSNDIICNGGPNPLVTPYPTDIINIPAGSPTAIQYDNVLQPNGWDPTNPADPVDPSHKGPVMIYMAKVPSALQADVTGLGWFKVFEDGYDGSQWGVDRMVANHGIVNFTVPACIPSGNYFLRAEMIALHPASSYPGAQFYPGCAQVNIVGGGSTQPPTVSLPAFQLQRKLRFDHSVFNNDFNIVYDDEDHFLNHHQLVASDKHDVDEDKFNNYLYHEDTQATMLNAEGLATPAQLFASPPTPASTPVTIILNVSKGAV
ncbi:hypothetical protein FRC04_011001 [Tulasnella sp. 424]|nr:hypothetical protein FRC04_011001 [Tulasnella sp. 424]